MNGQYMPCLKIYIWASFRSIPNWCYIFAFFPWTLSRMNQGKHETVINHLTYYFVEECFHNWASEKIYKNKEKEFWSRSWWKLFKSVLCVFLEQFIKTNNIFNRNVLNLNTQLWHFEYFVLCKSWNPTKIARLE